MRQKVVWHAVGGGLTGDFPVEVIRIMPESRTAVVTPLDVAGTAFTVSTATLHIYWEECV